MKIPRWGEVKWKPIPHGPYHKLKGGLFERHIWLHYLAHCTYCVLVSGMKGTYERFTPSEWIVHMTKAYKQPE